MRAVRRLPLPVQTQADLDARQAAADAKLAAKALEPETEWKRACSASSIGVARATLRQMAGRRERCMYCVDSHGSDIEHFWPKALYPKRMFRWPNLLLCCTECGRFKGKKFPVDDNGEPLLVDPAAEEPWLHLDFDPVTGNLVARFDRNTNAWSSKGQVTVETLRLDRREAVAAGYRKTLKRLAHIVENALAEESTSRESFIEQLFGADDHGLLGWCVFGTGSSELPFDKLRAHRPDLWQRLEQAVQNGPLDPPDIDRVG